MPPLLLDISCLCDAHTDAALELIHKAIGEEPPGGDIWDPHPNPFIRRLVELFTQRGLERIASLDAEMRRWLQGAEHVADLERPVRPPGAMVRWSRAEIGLVRAYLKALPPGSWVQEDWLMLVDYLVQAHLPLDDLRTEAEWLATRASLMGRVEAAMGDVTETHANTILAMLPTDLADMPAAWRMTPTQRATIDAGRARCAESVTALSDGARHRMRRMIVDYQEAVILGDKVGAAESLQSRLLDSFGMLNRDWRRIAVTEATENAGQGFVTAVGPGARLKRVEKYRGACAWCRSIDGHVVTVVDPGKADKDGALEVWPGKTNVGRSASPRKREAGALVEREPHEMWHIAAGGQHPNCRGSWVKAEEVAADPEFDAWLANLKRRGRG